MILCGKLPGHESTTRGSQRMSLAFRLRLSATTNPLTEPLAALCSLAVVPYSGVTRLPMGNSALWIL